jgi:hypothetical protein
VIENYISYRFALVDYTPSCLSAQATFAEFARSILKEQVKAEIIEV